MKNIEEIIENHGNNGLILTKDITKAGLHRSVLNDLVDSGKYEKIGRGMYHSVEEWEDQFLTLQTNYKAGIYSHETALYLFGYSERVPYTFHITFPRGYNCSSLKDKPVFITRVIRKNYELGLTEVKTPAGNIVKAYNIERCLCDMVKGKGWDLQTTQYAMKKYANSKEKDINKLMDYAKKLRVVPKIRNYMEVLLG